MDFSLPPTLESERLLVRMVEEADLAAVFKVHANDEVTRFLPYPTWRDMSEAHDWYERAMGHQANAQAMQFVIVEKRSGAAIGTCLLFRFERDSRRAEIGYSLGHEHWRSGYMREALSSVLEYAFGTLDLRRVEAEIDPRNAGSEKLLTRLGFKKEGLLRQRWQMKGEIKDAAFFGLLRDEWRREQA